MIDSRDHAVLDLTLAAGLGAIALWPGTAPRVRRWSGLGAVLTVAHAALTDYEAGLSGQVSLQTHRAIEAAAGAALLFAGLGAGGQRSGLLAAAGLAQIGLAGSSGDAARHGPTDIAYRPVDRLKPGVPDLWVVDSVVHGVIPIRMTVVRLHNGDLLLYSPTPHSPALQAELDAIGTIRHLIAPNIAHWMFVRQWQEAVPNTQVWAVPGLPRRRAVRRSGLIVDHVLGDQAPPAWADEIDQVLIEGSFGFAECAMFHRASGTALFTDLLQNFELRKLPWLLRPLAMLAGNVAPEGRAPVYLRALVGRGGRLAARRAVAWAPQRVIMTHGRPWEHEAAGRLRRSLAWLTGEDS